MLTDPSPKNAPRYATTYGLSAECSARSSPMTRLRISGWTFICTIFTARNAPVGTCTAFCTTPPEPLPHAPTTASSSRHNEPQPVAPPVAS